jgi:hypothetical protein
MFTGAVIAALVMLSVILTASVLYPNIDSKVILGVLLGGSALTFLVWLMSSLLLGGRSESIDRTGRETWRTPPLAALAPPHMNTLEKIWMAVLRGYLLIAGGLVLTRIVALAIGRHA